MKRAVSPIVLATILVGTSAHSAERLALLVGSSAGRAEQPLLRYTGADVGRMGAVLSELGGFSPSHVTRLQTERGQDVLDALQGLASSAEPADVFLFYYSGHGDSAGLQVGQTSLPLEVLLPAIRRVPARLRILLLDSCQSGAATARKGVVAGAPIEVRIDAGNALGEVVISSSSATEESFESESLAGAVFTVHWVSGLRGGADEDGDGAVTLSEAYRYAYGRTVSSTLLSSSGPQRPTFRWDLEGQHEPILATAGSSAKVTLQASRTGSFFIFDSEEQELIAELHTNEGQSARVLLGPGRYVVRQRTAREVRSAQIELHPRDDLILSDRQMEGARLVRLARKGGVGQWSLTAHAGQLFSSISQTPFLQVGAGGELERGILLLSLNATFITSSARPDGLLVQQSGGALSADVLFGFTLGSVTFRGGPSLGLLILHQDITGTPGATGGLGMLGVKARIEVEITHNIALLAMARGETWIGPATPPFGPLSAPLGSNWGVFLAAGWSLGLRAAF